MGKSVFLTGAAGTGKTFLTRVLVEMLEAQGKSVTLTASTGVAASLIGGVTLHSLLRLGAIEDEQVQVFLESRYDFLTKSWWNKTDSTMNPFLLRPKRKRPQPQSSSVYELDDMYEDLLALSGDEKLLQVLVSIPESKREKMIDQAQQQIQSIPSINTFVEKGLFPKDEETWSSINVLIVDEISMVSKNVFTALDLVSRLCRRKNDPENLLRPFGGLQLILVGDFYQLPPIKADFSFESPSWDGIEPVILETQHRQEEQDPLSWILAMLRANVFAEKQERRSEIAEIYRLLENRQVKDVVSSSSETTLVATKDTANRINISHQERLNQFNLNFKNDPMYNPNYKYDKYQFQQVIGTVLSLKKQVPQVKTESKQGVLISAGTRVMCTRNMTLSTNFRVYNGMIGIVTALFPATKLSPQERTYYPDPKNVIVQEVRTRWEAETEFFPYVIFENGKQGVIPGVVTEERIKVGSQLRTKSVTIELALIPAWAITMHRAQGLTLSRVQVNLNNAFVENQIYVALSRVRRLQDIKILGALPTPDNKGWLINAKVIEWTRTQHERVRERERERATGRREQGVLTRPSILAIQDQGHRGLIL